MDPSTINELARVRADINDIDSNPAITEVFFNINIKNHIDASLKKHRG